MAFSASKVNSVSVFVCVCVWKRASQGRCCQIGQIPLSWLLLTKEHLMRNSLRFCLQVTQTVYWKLWMWRLFIHWFFAFVCFVLHHSVYLAVLKLLVGSNVNNLCSKHHFPLSFHWLGLILNFIPLIIASVYLYVLSANILTRTLKCQQLGRRGNKSASESAFRQKIDRLEGKATKSSQLIITDIRAARNL